MSKFQKLFGLLAILLMMISCRKDEIVPNSFDDLVQGSWKLESAMFRQNGGWYNALHELEGTTVVFKDDTLIWHNPTHMRKAIGRYKVFTEVIESNCQLDDEGNETDDCDITRKISISSALNLLTPINQNAATPTYIDLVLGQTLTLNPDEVTLSDDTLRWKIWRDSKWYKYTFVRP